DDVETKRIGFFCGTQPFTTIHARSDLDPLEEVEFNGRKMYMPNNMREVLTNLYGDYMQLPPVEKRYNHAPEIVRFDENDISVKIDNE
ncbi:MAG: LicD family protein, partial [Kandleria vitulina]|uniref:LicD family protein n=1 Tax=Kandleria vitulina TaxID=1630 RepID=UPI002E789DED